MVNTGQPSTACIQCRFRRIKCDATKPHCERCTLYGIVCPGYPERSLVFRDDTTLVRERAERKYERKRRNMRRDSITETFAGPAQTPSSDSTWLLIDGDSQRQPSTNLFPLLHPHETEIVAKAVNDFLSQWTNPNVELWWDILNPTALTSMQPFEGECLSTALQATSVMTVASRTGFQNQELLRVAAKMYGSALRSINLAVQSPTECIQDKTILAVTLTALFETMQESADDNLTTAHLRGMMSMINARGPDQFQTIAGQRIFLFAYFSWTSSAMPDMIVTPEKASDLIPPLSRQLTEILQQANPISDEPAFVLLPLIQRSILLRFSSIPLLTTASSTRDPQTPRTILESIDTLDISLLDWNRSLPPQWGKQDHLYQLLTTSWFRTHRIFLADLAIRCLQVLAEISNESQDEEIWKRIDAAQLAVDEICVRTPYTFAPHDKPELRKPDPLPRIIPAAGLTYLYHSSFDYPLLIASMVSTLPSFRQRAIAQARIESAQACGLQEPRRRYPKALVCVSEEERERYIQHRVERHQKWINKQRETDSEFECPFDHEIEGHECGLVVV